MFEGLVHQLLVGYLGNYVKDIHKDQFRIGLWKGEVLLENVELVLEAFDYLQLPFAIKKGVIGKLSIKIPWKKLGWDPILIALEDVYVCTCRRDDSEWSVGAVEARELAGKKANLAAAELAKLSRRVSDNQAGQSFISYLSAKIIDNIQVTIRNVHIRYVDQNPDSRVIFSLGLRFSTLMITTSDVNSAGGRLKGGQVNKLLQIHDMGLYWNSREIYSNEVATEDMHGVQSSSDTTLDDGELNYILKPLSATLSLMVSKSGRFESGTPQYAVNLDLNDLVLTMDGIQIYQMLMLWDYVSVCRLREKYGRFRPWTQYILARTGVGWQRMWWRYAINAVLADVRRKLCRTSWIYFGSRLNARRKYIKLYRLKLERLQQDQHLDDASFHELEEMEKELEMDEILNYRSLAECQLQLVDLCPMANGHDSESDSKDSMLEKQHSGEQTSNKPRGWLNWLSLGMLGAGGTTDSSQFAGVISDEVIKDIYEATEYNPASSLESGMVSKGHSYLLSIGINARQVIVTLNSTRKKVAIICMTIHGANLNSNFWKDSASASIILNSLEVVNPSSDYLPFSFVLRNKDNVCSDGFLLSEAPSCNSYKEFVTIEIEMLPQSSNFDFSVRAIIQPFEFVYDVNLLENLSEFFGVLASFQSHLDLVLSSLNGFENNEARVLSKAEYIFSNRKSVSFEANFQNAVFIFPWCSADCNWSRMVFSMKSMHFVSVVGEGVSTQKFKNGQFYSSSKNMLYNTKAVQDDDLSMLEAFNDRFELKLSGVQGKLETPNTLSNVAFIQAFDAKITVDRCVLQDELAMNQLKVHGVLPSIHFLLSSSVCNALKEFSTNHWLKPDDFKREQMTVRLNNVSHDCKVREGSSFGSIGVDNLSTDQPGISLNSKKSTTNMLSVVRYKVMLELKSLSIELCLDDGDETCQEKLTLHAQIENMNVESVQGACGCKLGIGMETINVEVPNVVGSPAYSILCTKKILSTGSSTIRVDDNFASMPISSLSNKELKSGLEGKFVCFLCQHIQQTDCVTATIKVSLNNLECHCHPKVIGTLHRFFCDVIFEESMLSGVRTVDNAPVMEVGKAETAQQSVPNIKCPKVVISRLDDFSKNLGISSDQYPFVCFKNGLSKNHDKSCTIDSANNEKDASVFDKTVKTEDGAAYTKLSGDIEPNNLGTTTVMDVNSGINESDASDKYTFKIDLEVDSTDIHFHDSACVLATVVIPKSKSFVFLSKENALWDVMIYFEGVRLLSLWAPATLGEVLWGPLFHGPCPIVNLRILKKEKINGCSELEMSVSIQHICCVLPSDFLAVVIGYFAFSHWEKYLQTESDLSKSKEILTSENTSSHFHFKVEVIDSVLILPVETSCNEFLELGLPELFFTLLPSCTIPYKNGNLNNESTPAVYLSASKMDFIDVAGRQLSLSFASTRNDEPKLYGKDSCLASAKLPLIERLDADLSLRIPCDVKGSSHYPFVPTSIVFNCQSFEANVLEKCFLTGVLAIEDVVLKLSTVNTISKLFVSSVSQFRESIVEFKYSKTIKSEVPPAHSVDVKFFMSNVLLKLHTSREEAVDVLELIGKVDARRLKVSGFWRNESLEALALEILSLDVISCSNSVTLLNCISEESSHPGIDVHLCTLDTGISEASISVPRIDIWLHLSAWSELVVFAITCIQSPSRTEYVSLGSSQTGFTDTGEFNDVVQPYSRRSDGSDIRPRHFCLKSETLNVYIHIPDYSSEDNVGVSAKEHGNRQGLYQHDSSVKLDDREKHFMGPGSPFYKFLSFSLSVYLDEVILLDGKWIFKARIVQIQGKTENFQEQCVHCLPFCHIADIELEGKAWDECAQLQKLILSIQMDTVDLWCSYPILSFWHNFNFEQSKKTSSMASAFSLDVCIGIHKAAFLLSDGRWSCNAPIMEIFVRHIHFRANWRNGTLESSISLEVQMNYHNIHKVTWEPFLEPWSLQCHLIRNFGCNGLLSTSPMTNIHIDSLSQLNLNLTEALMQAAVRGNEMIKDMLDGFRSDDCPGNHQVEEYSPLGNAHVRRYAPYFLQNDTGMLLYFWLIRGPTIVENNEILDRAVRSSVEPGCAMPLFVEETPEELFQRRRPNQSSERLVDRKSSGSRHHMICIQLEGTSRASMPMSMDLVGLRSLEVDFSKTFGTRQRHQEQDPPAGIGIQETINKAYSNSKFVVPVILEVSTQRYSKLVRLYSTVTLVNATCVSLEVRFDIPFGIAPKVMDPILPGQELALPVHLAETGRIRYRPLGSSYLWSEAQSLTNVLSQDNRHGLLRSFACYPSHPTDGPFRCCISVRESTVPCYSGMKQYSFDFQDQNSGNNLNDNETTGSSVSVAETKASFIRQIRLTAPLVLKNCLPVTLAFSIENGAGVAVNIFASEGDAVSVFEIDSAHELGIAFHIAGFTPSFVKFPRSAMYDTELGKVNSDAGKILITETLILNPDSSKGLPVSIKVEKALDAFCGSRELCLSVPFWLYNCSGLTLEAMDGDMDEQVDHRVVYSSYSDMRQEQLMNPKSGMAIACADLLSTIDNDVTYRRGIHWENRDVPCKIWNHLPSRKIISNRVLAHGSTSESSGYFEDNSLGISGFSSFNGSDRWPRKGGNMSFSNCEGGKIEVGGKGIDQIPKFHNTCMHSPAKGLQTSEATLRLRISQSKYVEDAMEGSAWSHPFSLNPPNGSTPVLIPYPFSTGAVIISAIRTPVLGACAGKTTAITFQPRYVISNACSRDLCYRQRGTDSFRRLRVGEHFNLHWTDVKREFLVCVRFDEPGWDWSGSFHPDQLGDTLVKLRNYVTGALQMVRVEVQNASAAVGDVKSVDNSDGSLGTYLILLSDDDTGFMPYRIDNFSMERLRFYQQKCEKFENIVQPYACCSYAWDEPSYPHRLVIEVPGEGLVGSYSLDDVRDYTPVHLSATPDKSERRFSISVHAEGPIKVLSITSEHMHISKPSNAQGLHKFGERNTATGQIKDNCMDLSEKITVCLPFIGLSIIDSVPQELAFACARGIKIQILQGLHQQKLILQVASVQFDNQLPHPIYPVMVCNENASSGPLSFQGKAKDNNLERAADVICEASPDIAFFISAVKWRHMATSVVCFESVTVRVAALRLEFEEHMILRLVDFVKSLSWRFWKGSTQEQNSDMWILKYGIGQVNTSSTDVRNFEFVKNPHSSQLHFLKVMKVMESYKSEPSPAAVMPIAAPWQQIFLLARRRRKIYVEIFHIAPMKLTISFSSTPWLPKDDRKAATQSLMWISSTTLQRGLLALMDVEGAPIYFRQLTLAHPLASWDAIQGMVVRHYTRQLLHEVYKVLGSVGVFGNPMGFARSLGFGIRDFISVPAKSIVQNPGGIVTGMAQGTRSLLNNTVFAVSNAAAQFSKAARKGVVAFAFDEEFVAEIERRQQGQGSHNQGVLNDFLEGLTGLLQSPIRGAEKHGLPGILSGIAVGAAGLIARPVVSILEVSGRTAQSIRNRSNPSQLNHFRVRFPRPLVRDSPLLPYSWEEAVGTAVLQEVESKRLKDEVLVTCIALGFPGLFIVLTERLLLKVKSACIAAAASPENNMPGGPDWSIQQEISLDNIIHVDREGQLLNVLAGSQETYFRRRKDPTTSKKNYMSHFVPFTQETIVLPHEDAAKELSQLLGSLLDELKKHSSPSILRRENLRSVR